MVLYFVLAIVIVYFAGRFKGLLDRVRSDRE